MSELKSVIKEDQGSNWSLIKRLIAFSWQYRGYCLSVLMLQVLVLGMNIFGLRLAGLGVDAIHHFAGENVSEPDWPFGWVPPSDWSAMNVVSAIAAGIAAMAILKSVINYFYAMAVAWLVQIKVVPELRGIVYEKLQRLSFGFFDRNASGSIINRLTGDVQAVRMFIDGVLMEVMVMVLSLAIFLSFMISIHPMLTLACLATTPLLWVASVMFSRRARPALVENRRLVDRMVLALSETVQGIHAVKGFGREKEEIERFERASDEVRDQMMGLFRMFSIFAPAVNLLTQINIAALLLYGGYLVYAQELPLGGGMVVFAGLLQQFSNQIANISGLANRVQRSLTGARRVFEILDTPIDVDSKEGATRLEAPKGEVEFCEVSFAFKEGDSVLRGVSLKANPGERVAIVGATGSGKSALLSLIPRFYDTDEGVVKVDGVSTRDLDLDDLRKSIGIVFQESFMFSNSIAANISFGNPYATEAQIVAAAKVAAAHEFIMEMPQGYDTVLSEGGSNLSGGQRQRLAIARAVLLDPKILILDDPTAAIDAETEDEILGAMDNAMKGRTTFVVAHRMSTLRRSDKVIVLEKGKVVQMGTHEELLAARGLYRNLARLQVVDDLETRNEILDSEVAS